MARFVLLTFVGVFLTISCTLGREDAPLRRLDEYTGHYEHIYYDKDELIHHHHRLKRSGSEGKGLKLSFSAFNRHFNLVLHPDDHIFHKRTVFHDSDGELPKTQMKSYLYAGHDIDNPSVKVTGNLAFGVFEGKIKDVDEVYYIESSKKYWNESESHSIIYRLSDVDQSRIIKDHPDTTPCGATTRTQQRNLASLFRLKRSNDVLPLDRPRLSKRQDTNLIRCNLNVVADYKFYSSLTDSDESESIRRAQAISLISSIVGDGSDNFEKQDFDMDGNPDKIHFSIFNLTIETSPPEPSSPFSNEFLGAAAYLDAHSSADYSDFCLSYRFTYRDFDQGVLGLAFVAATGSRGGICDDESGGQTFNTGIVTLLNFNARVNNVVAGLTFTHEAGHNFGSQHDPATEECQPSSGGKYVMFDRANDGSQPNNQNFSPCSRRMMITQIQTKGQRSRDGCFLDAEDDCGNNVIDPGEACDCGLNYDTGTMLCNDDPCCNGTSCQLANQAECSPVEGRCCFDNCTFIGESFLCRIEDECALSQTCNGSSAVCPASEIRIANTSSIICKTDNNMTRFCQNGECVGSICIPLGLEDCECTDEDEQCHVCCTLLDGTCESTITIAETNETARNLIPGNVGQVLGIGFPCNDFNGYCNFFNICQPINTEGAIKRLANQFFDSDAIRSVVNFFKDYWWAPIVGAVVIIIAMFLLVLACHFLLPRPKHMKKRAERRKSIRQSRRGGRNRIISGYPDQQGQYPMRQYR